MKAGDTDGSKSSLAREIIIHPEWDINSTRYDADLSIVVLQDVMTFTDHIQPVCLPSISNGYVTETGISVFYRTSENKEKELQTEFEIPSVNASHCYTLKHELAFISSPRIFCAGYENQPMKAPCLGDFGGGFYVFAEEDKSWKIRGVATGTLTGPFRSCTINSFMLYINVSKFSSWIYNTIAEK